MVATNDPPALVTYSYAKGHTITLADPRSSRPSPTLSPLDLRRPSVSFTFADPQSPLPSPTLSPFDLRRPPTPILFQIALLLQNSYLPVVTIAESRLYLILASESRTDPNRISRISHPPIQCLEPTWNPPLLKNAKTSLHVSIYQYPSPTPPSHNQ
jgi:hypothetical protein